MMQREAPDTHTHLLGAGRQHGQDGEADRGDGQGRRPLVVEDGEAYMPVAIHVRMQRDGIDKRHLGRLEGVVGAEGEGEGEGFGGVERALGPVYLDPPPVARLGAGVPGFEGLGLGV